MEIIAIPHPTLREKAEPVTAADIKVKKFAADLQKTLVTTKNPKGVGLAAPQVNKLWRIFATQVDDKPRLFINPQITSKSSTLTLGPDPEDPIMEGCLSIPKLYGPVPRAEWVELSFDVIKGNELVSQKDRFEDYFARVIQHELDHLDGVLFIDYSLQYDLPVYQELGKDNYRQVEREFLELI